jgi:hypothetical protein
MKNNTVPLHTNSNKKIVFLFSVFASAFFNIMLFSSIGENIGIRIIWGLVGVSAVFFQTAKLREFFNTTKSIRYLHLAFYIICTVGSIAGTLGAGYSHIEKTKLNNIDNTTQIELLDKMISDIETVDIDETDTAINTAMTGTNLNQWAVIRLIKEKNKFQVAKTNIYNRLFELKSKKATLLKSQSGVISSLSGLSKLFNVSESFIAFIFLIFVSVILELMVYGSATFTGALFRQRTKKVLKFKKKKKDGQIYLFK